MRFIKEHEDRNWKLNRLADETNTVIASSLAKDNTGTESNGARNFLENDYEHPIKDVRNSKYNKASRRKNKSTVNYLEGVLNDVKREVFKNYKTIMREIKYIDNDPASSGQWYVCTLHTGTLFRVSNRAFELKIQQYEHSGNINSPKTYIRGMRYGQRIFYIAPKEITMKEQLGFANVKSMFDKVISMFALVKDTVNSIKTARWGPIIADVLALIINLRDGYLSVPKVLAAILQIYSLDNRIKDIFAKEGSFFTGQTSGTEVLTMLGIAGLPKQLLEAVKTFTSLTGKRIFDSGFVMKCFSSLVTVVKHLLTYVGQKEKEITGTDYTRFLTSFVDYVGSSAVQYDRITKVIEAYTSYVKNATIIHDARWRAKTMELHEECMSDPNFMEYILNSSSKDFNITWRAFKENVVKMCKTYGVSNRLEPVAFLFEGGAGSGKTTLMNSFVEYLSKKDQSVYVHTVPAAESGKDFYDDYNNEDVFVMDDVGQQGKSQWRTLINFVSTTRYPLDCARAENKNTKSFNSSLILATTNHFRDLSGFTSSDCITEPDALFRRPHVIDVSSHKDANGYFYQVLQYYRYDFRATVNTRPGWIGDFLDPHLGCPVNASLDTSRFPPGQRKVASLRWLSQVVAHVRDKTKEDNIRSTISEEEVRSIDNFMWDSQSNILKSLANSLVDPVFERANIWKEWCLYEKDKYAELCSSYFTWLSDNILSLVAGGATKKISGYVSSKYSSLKRLWESFDYTDENVSLTLGIVLTGVIALVSAYYLYEGEFDGDNIDLFVKACEDAKERKDEHLWLSQSSGSLEESDNTSRRNVLKQHMRMVVMRSDNGPNEDTFTQAIVSGDKILVPCHAWPHEAQLDIYTSVEAYKNQCKEREDIKVKRIKIYPGCDLAIYQMERLVARYKNCNNLFLNATVKNPLLYLINSYTTIPVLLGVSCVSNSEIVRYSTYVHAPKTGFYTPLTAGGACGTVLFSDDHGIVGFHVAGGDRMGFCVVPPRVVAEEIRNLMLHKEDVPYEFGDKIEPNYSGARLRYPDGYVKPTNVLKESSLVPTIFNIECNEDIARLKDSIMDDRSIAPVKMDVIRDKVPPVFDAAGSPHAQLKTTARKTCKLQGRLCEAELEFVRECIDTLLPDFDDVPDDVCAFGDSQLTALNRDSSNGYGFEKGKDAYFDFPNKVIYPHTLEKFNEFLAQVEAGDVDIREVLSVECFKDELRTSDKKESPRTFRIMPLQHIWWSKKIFGRIMSHFKNTRHATGMCIGFNPFKDCNELALKLKECQVTGDIDFSKWDGSIMSRLMYLIGDAFKAKYKGKHAKMLDYLISSSATSCVLVNDELIATTHGLPSGTWLTLVMNSLINKCLTALTLYRNDENPTVTKFARVVDYVMGDDKVIGASSKDAHWFNLFTINDVATSLGMTCTNGDKTPIRESHQPFDKLTFVKRHFRYHPILNEYTGCLSVETLLGTIQWMDSGKNTDEVLQGKVRSVLVEAYLHSPRLYREFKRVFDKYRPGDAFSEERIISILRSNDGYFEVLKGLGKDHRFLE